MKIKILLIEDNKDMRENTAEILELSKYQVITAQNGKVGVDIAMKEKPDLIICDIMMPQLDGYGVLHALSHNEETATIPFIFLTAKADRGDLRKGMEMGADDYVTKPFEDIELLHAVESRLRKSALMRREFEKSLEGLNEFIGSARDIEDLKRLSDKNDMREFRKKESVYTEGNYPRGIFFIHKGKIKTYKTHDSGKELITGLFKEGDFFGYLSLLEEGKYTDTAEAMEDSSVCYISKEDFQDLLFRNAQVSRRFLRMLSDNLAEKEERLVKLAYNSVRKRVSEALTTLYNRYKKDGENSFSMPISREDLANLAGTATETTIRTLSDFKDEGLIEIKGGTIAVLKYDKLLAMRN